MQFPDPSHGYDQAIGRITMKSLGQPRHFGSYRRRDPCQLDGGRRGRHGQPPLQVHIQLEAITFNQHRYFPQADLG